VVTTRTDPEFAVHADAGTAAASSALARGQRLRSLGRANQIRSARALLKKELASGHVQIEDVLARPPLFATTAKISELLLAVPGFGPVRTTRSLARCQIPYGKTAAGLSGRQRSALIALLRTEKPRHSRASRKRRSNPTANVQAKPKLLSPTSEIASSDAVKQ
jgi:hypothetical protein